MCILKGTKPAELPVEHPTKFHAGDQSENSESARVDDPLIGAVAG
jgi:hypothetical protein